jgi:hypothetical protein
MGLINSPRQSSRPVSSITQTPNSNCSSTSIYILRHVDYSSKYGLGYILSNGYYGVYFNDSSKICLNPSNNDVTFIPARC